jgi:hypothetical protein
MKNYSIVRIGNEYVVQADDKSILKVSSRRKAVKLVSIAAELLDLQPVPSLVPEAHAEASIAGDPGIIPDSGIILDPGIILDRGITPDPCEAP